MFHGVGQELLVRVARTMRVVSTLRGVVTATTAVPTPMECPFALSSKNLKNKLLYKDGIYYENFNNWIY